MSIINMQNMTKIFVWENINTQIAVTAHSGDWVSEPFLLTLFYASFFLAFASSFSSFSVKKTLYTHRPTHTEKQAAEPLWAPTAVLVW